MKIWISKIAVPVVVWICALVGGRAATAQPVDAAIQAIQQAPDPSAAIAAYANGVATDRNNPKLYEAYVSRMVDLGLPEMAYHQAETLTTLQANNGLAWGVVAYVDARRAQMPEAISAINLAGQFAPDDKFVQHTAGESSPGTTSKRTRQNIPDNAKDGLTRVRNLLDKQPSFTEAYSDGPKGLSDPGQRHFAATQTAPRLQQCLGAPPQPWLRARAVPNAPQANGPPSAVGSSGAGDQSRHLDMPPRVLPLSVYYPLRLFRRLLGLGSGLLLRWGPGWVAPMPWCWWQPCGFWGGCDFLPSEGCRCVSVVLAVSTVPSRRVPRPMTAALATEATRRSGTTIQPGPKQLLWNTGPAKRFGDSVGAGGFSGHSPLAATATGSGAHWWSAPSAQRGSLATTGAGARGGANPPEQRALDCFPPEHHVSLRAPSAQLPLSRSWTGGSTPYRVISATRGMSLSPILCPQLCGPGGSSWAAPSYRAPVYQAPRYPMPSPRLVRRIWRLG